MPSEFDQLDAEMLLPAGMEEFGERDGNSDFVPVVITLPGVGLQVTWPRVILGTLEVVTVENHERISVQESTWIEGPTDELPIDATAIPEEATIVVTKYGVTPFHVDHQQSRFGGVMTKLALLRAPVRKTNDYRESRAT